MNSYVQGSIVRTPCTFTFDVPEETFFRLCSLPDGIAITSSLETPVDDLTIVIDGGDPMKCIVDIDTFARPGIWEYWFYTRGTNKAGGKGTFEVT